MMRYFTRDGPRFSTMLTLEYKHRDGVIPNSLAFSYIVCVYPLSLLSLILLCQNASELALITFLAAAAVSTLLLSHSLIIAAYLLHECAHNTLFKTNQQNAFVGSVISWFVGAACTPYEHIRDKHFRHHVQREDVLAVNAHQLMESKPTLKSMLKFFTFFHVPAFEVYTHLLALFAPFYVQQMSGQKSRVVIFIISRLAFFLCLASFSVYVVLFYFVAWMILLSVLNFMDSMQHSYEIHYTLFSENKTPRFDADYEEKNTYSNLISERFPWLNLLVLNFTYHNAHHHKPTEPWYRLPAVHQQFYPQVCAQQVSLSEQLRRFHHYRLKRLSAISTIDEAGVDGVSFLVGV